MIRTLFVTARILLAIAWLVWLIFLFIPQVEFVVHGSSSYNNLFNGFVVTAAAFFYAFGNTGLLHNAPRVFSTGSC